MTQQPQCPTCFGRGEVSLPTQCQTPTGIPGSAYHVCPTCGPEVDANRYLRVEFN